ncbi:MAG: Crp/Fnr family transcriptional regulator [Deltaproteobacteria bacterium]|nr:Crp/Fnr family transcriptional regulator [Deltaproteobacteria bacterium]
MSGASPRCERDLDPLEGEARARSFAAGEIVFDEGDPGAALYLVRSGCVEILRRGAGGMRCVARLGPGSLFGEQGAFVAGRRRSRARVAQDAELLEVEAGLFEQMCLERGDIALRVSKALADRADALEQRLASLAEEDGLRAVTRALLRLARPAPQGARVEATLRLLAADSGLALVETWRAMQRLVESRLVRLVDDVLVVPDPDALAASLEAGSAPAR